MINLGDPNKVYGNFVDQLMDDKGFKEMAWTHAMGGRKAAEVEFELEQFFKEMGEIYQGQALKFLKLLSNYYAVFLIYSDNSSKH
jgi:hypothetical protein